MLCPAVMREVMGDVAFCIIAKITTNHSNIEWQHNVHYITLCVLVSQLRDGNSLTISHSSEKLHTHQLYVHTRSGAHKRNGRSTQLRGTAFEPLIKAGVLKAHKAQWRIPWETTNSTLAIT